MFHLAGSRAIRAIVIRRRKHNVLTDAEVPFCSEDIMSGVRQLLAQPHSREPGNIEAGKQASHQIQFVPALEVSARQARTASGLPRSREGSGCDIDKQRPELEYSTPGEGGLRLALHGIGLFPSRCRQGTHDSDVLKQVRGQIVALLKVVGVVVCKPNFSLRIFPDQNL